MDYYVKGTSSDRGGGKKNSKGKGTVRKWTPVLHATTNTA